MCGKLAVRDRSVEALKNCRNIPHHAANSAGTDDSHLKEILHQGLFFGAQNDCTEQSMRGLPTKMREYFGRQCDAYMAYVRLCQGEIKTGILLHGKSQNSMHFCRVESLTALHVRGRQFSRSVFCKFRFHLYARMRQRP